MPARSEITYFGAGPALLPTDVLQTAAAALLDYQNTGLGIAEHSHRSQLATDIINNAKADLSTYLDIPTSDYEIVFMQGGGTGEFSATIYNLVGLWVARKQAQIASRTNKAAIRHDDEVKVADDLKDGDGLKPTNGESHSQSPLQEADIAPEQQLRQAVDQALKLDYIVTGSWSLKAYQEAQRLLGPEKVNLVADARTVNNGKFGKIPDESTWKLSKDAAMVYYCDNETVDGVEFPGFPEILKPKSDGSGPIVVADMSSNILSRRVPVSNYSLLFFGAQKNLGSTGVTVAVIKRSFLPPTIAQPAPELMRKLGLPIAPLVLSYELMAKNNSLYNTLSIFDVYIAGQVLKKLLLTYPTDKVDGQEAIANRKAKLIYDALEKHPDVYKIVPDKSARSRMNICFRVVKNDKIDESETMFLKMATSLGLTGLKGHRSVGGIRASNYNSVPESGAEKLAGFIDQFAMV